MVAPSRTDARSSDLTTALEWVVASWPFRVAAAAISWAFTLSSECRAPTSPRGSSGTGWALMSSRIGQVCSAFRMLGRVKGMPAKPPGAE